MPYPPLHFPIAFSSLHVTPASPRVCFHRHSAVSSSPLLRDHRRGLGEVARAAHTRHSGLLPGDGSATPAASQRSKQSTRNPHNTPRSFQFQIRTLHRAPAGPGGARPANRFGNCHYWIARSTMGLYVAIKGVSEILGALAASRLTVGHRGVLASRRRLPQDQPYIYLALRG